MRIQLTPRSYCESILTWYQSYLDLQIKYRVFELYLFEGFSKEIRVFALQVQPTVLSLSAQEEMEYTHVLLAPFNYFECKAEMVMQLRLKGM